MAIMELLKPKLEKLYCRLRKEWVAALPEEKVRQALLTQLIDEMGYPASGIAVEKALKQMPHINSKQKLPVRRADLISFAPGIHPLHALYPLLLIECKAVPLNQAVINQVVSYNHFVKAYYIAVANQEEIRLGWYDGQKYRFQNGLSTYETLISNTPHHF